MKVKLCSRCPYSPIDVASHYDAGAAIHLCVGCDDKPVVLGYPRDVRKPPMHVRLLNDAYLAALAAQ